MQPTADWVQTPEEEGSFVAKHLLRSACQHADVRGPPGAVTPDVHATAGPEQRTVLTLKQKAEEEAMATNEETISQLQDEVKGLEVSQAVQGATLAGAQATQAAAHAGTWSTMLAGAAGLVVGMFLAIAIGGTRRR